MEKSPFFHIDENLLEKGRYAEVQCQPIFEKLEKIRQYNSEKVLYAFSKNRISAEHLMGSTGYGYDDRGRDTLDRVFADTFGAEDALVRHHFASGTATLATMLFGILRPGDLLVSVTGTPYDTLHATIGLSGEKGQGSLMDFGVNYREIRLTSEGKLDILAILSAAKEAKMLYFQRSRGYSLRPSLQIAELEEAFSAIRAAYPEVILAVDNCYGEFMECLEPTNVGADIMAGSLIKNPGGGIARTGGYIAGRHDLIELCANRLTSPGVGREVGASLGENESLYLGFFLAPNTSIEALKTAVFSAALFEILGYEVSPKWDAHRADIIEAIQLGSEEKLRAFCKGIQQGAPIDSYVTPEPWGMPGYDDPVIMAAGAFHNGASIELSADGPVRSPYAVWLQGGLTYPTGRTGILLAAQSMKDAGVL